MWGLKGLRKDIEFYSEEDVCLEVLRRLVLCPDLGF